MKRKTTWPEVYMKRRIVSLLIISSLFFSLFAVSVFAASGSKKKTVYVPVKVTTYNKSTNVKNVKRIKYNKKGLPIKILYGDLGAQEVLKYTKKGHLKSRQFINNGIAYYKIFITTNKKGLVTKQKRKPSVEEPTDIVVTYKYDKQGRLRKITRKAPNTTVIHIDKYGNDTSSTSDGDTKYVYKNTLNKRKDAVKITTKMYENGILVDRWTGKQSYKYDKKGNIISKTYDDGNVVVKYQYKKFRVSKTRYKFLKWFLFYAMAPETTQHVDLI